MKKIIVFMFLFFMGCVSPQYIEAPVVAKIYNAPVKSQKIGGFVRDPEAFLLIVSENEKLERVKVSMESFIYIQEGDYIKYLRTWQGRETIEELYYK